MINTLKKKKNWTTLIKQIRIYTVKSNGHFGTAESSI